MNFFSKIVFILAGTALLAACDSDNDNSNQDVPEAATFKVQVLHGSPDAPAVNVVLDEQQVLSDVDYKQGSGRLTLEASTYPVQVDGILPGGSAPVIGPVELEFAGDTIYTIVAVNSVLAIEPVILAQPDTPVSAGSARLFVLHGAASAPEVDVYVTAPGAELAASAPVGSFGFKGTLGPVEVAAGNYQIRATAAGDAAAVVYDSGEITLADGSDLVVTALPTTVDGAAPISLVALTGEGTLELADINTPTALRVGHLSPDTPEVDVVVNGGEYLGDVPFPAVTNFDTLPADTYNVAVQAAGNPGVVPIGPVDLPLDAGTYYSVLAVNYFASIEPLILTDDPRPVATNARVRIVHAAPTAGTVDVYAVAPGTDINSVEPTLSGFAFKDNTGYLALPAGDYEVTVTPAGTKDAAIGPATISIENGGVYTAIARDPLPESAEFGLIVLADLAIDD